MKQFQTHQLPGRSVQTEDGKEYLYFSGTDYLGMGHNEDFRNYLHEGLLLYGNHYGSSRNNSLKLAIYDEAESAFAQFAGAPSSLIVSSGIWAGQLVMKEIEAIILSFKAPSSIQYHYAPRVHPALWGNQYEASNNSWSEWARKTIKYINEDIPGGTHVICTDAVGSPWAEKFDLLIFSKLLNTENTWLIIDESHGLGVSGPNGSGNYSELATSTSANVIVLSSLNKALGIPAGAIYGKPKILDLLRNSPWFAGASPPAPSYLYVFLKLLQEGVYAKAWNQSQINISYFKNKLADNLFTQLAYYPVFCSRQTALFDHLLNNGIMGSCFSYPSPTDAPVVRLALSALHQKEDLDRLAEVCMTFKA